MIILASKAPFMLEQLDSTSYVELIERRGGKGFGLAILGLVVLVTEDQPSKTRIAQSFFPIMDTAYLSLDVPFRFDAIRATLTPGIC